MNEDKIITSEKVQTVLRSINDPEKDGLKKIKIRIQYIAAIIKQIPEPLSEGAYLIISRNGIFKDAYLLEKEQIFIGRNENSDIMLDSENVSRQHCTVIRNSMSWELRDMNSSNGLSVNYKKFQRRILCEGDLIAVGSFELIYFISKNQETFLS